MPIARAIQRDEQEIERWRVEVWPRLKAEASRERRSLVFVDESGFYLLPGKVRTYAPESHTPVLHEWQTHDHLSVMGAVTLTGKLYVLVRQESLNGLHTIEFPGDRCGSPSEYSTWRRSCRRDRSETPCP